MPKKIQYNSAKPAQPSRQPIKMVEREVDHLDDLNLKDEYEMTTLNETRASRIMGFKEYTAVVFSDSDEIRPHYWIYLGRSTLDRILISLTVLTNDDDSIDVIYDNINVRPVILRGMLPEKENNDEERYVLK